MIEVLSVHAKLLTVLTLEQMEQGYKNEQVGWEQTGRRLDGVVGIAN